MPSRLRWQERLHKAIIDHKWTAARRYLLAYPDNAAADNSLGRRGDSGWRAAKEAHTSLSDVPLKWRPDAADSDDDSVGAAVVRKGRRQHGNNDGMNSESSDEDSEDEERQDELDTDSDDNHDDDDDDDDDEGRTTHDDEETVETSSIVTADNNGVGGGSVLQHGEDDGDDDEHARNFGAATGSTATPELLDDVDDLQQTRRTLLVRPPKVSEMAPLIQFLLNVPPPPVVRFVGGISLRSLSAWWLVICLLATWVGVRLLCCCVGLPLTRVLCMCTCFGSVWCGVQGTRRYGRPSSSD